MGYRSLSLKFADHHRDSPLDLILQTGACLRYSKDNRFHHDTSGGIHLSLTMLHCRLPVAILQRRVGGGPHAGDGEERRASQEVPAVAAHLVRHQYVICKLNCAAVYVAY